MKHILEYKADFSYDEEEKKKSIKNLKKLPQDLKKVAMDYIQYVTRSKNGKVTGLSLHSELKKKIDDHDWPSGFDMGVDKDGYFIHTHRARSKSYKSPDKIPARDIKFIDSTG
jgi:hypothetical protein